MTRGSVLAGGLCGWMLLAALPVAACTTLHGIEPRFLTHQMDGDTISLFTFPQGKVKFRIQGIDTPERNEPGWEDARDFTWRWLQNGPFTVTTCWKPTLDRYEAVISRNDEVLADTLRVLSYGK